MSTDDVTVKDLLQQHIAHQRETCQNHMTNMNGFLEQIVDEVKKINNRLELGEGRFSNLEKKQDDTERRLTTIEERYTWRKQLFSLFVKSALTALAGGTVLCIGAIISSGVREQLTKFLGL